MNRTGRRLLLVRPSVVVTGVLCYGITWAAVNLLARVHGFRPHDIFPGPLPDLGVLMFFAAIYGFYRAAAHPWFNPGYRRWLALTPWADPMPLPLGSAAPNWRDLLVVLPMALLARSGSYANPLLPPVAVSIAYLFVLSIALARAGEGAAAAAFGIAFGLGGVVRLLPDLPWIAVIVAALHVLAYVGYRHSLRAFPWKERPMHNAAGKLGGYFALLGPVDPKPPLPFTGGVVAGLFAGWWVYCVVAQRARYQDVTQDLGIVAAGSFVVALIRLGVYNAGHAGATGLRGRLGSGRWLIPEYDQVFVGPICTAAAGLLGSVAFPPLIEAGYATTAGASGLVAAVAIALALNVGPSLRRWRLTGGHRIVPRAGPGAGRNPRAARGVGILA